MPNTEQQRIEDDFIRRLPGMTDDDFMVVVRDSYNPDSLELYSYPRVIVAIEREIFVRMRNTAEVFAVLMSAASELLTRHPKR